MKLRDLKRAGIGILCMSMLFIPVKYVNATGTTYYGTGTTAGNNNVIGGTGTTAGNNNVAGGNDNTTGSNNTGADNDSDSSSNNSDNGQQTQQPEKTDKPITSDQSDNNGNQNDTSNQQKPENTEEPIIADKPDKSEDTQQKTDDEDDKNNQDTSYENQSQNSSGNLGGNVTKEENSVESVEKNDDSWKSESYDNTGTLERGAVEGVSSATEGYYAAKGVNGCAVVTSVAQIKQDYGLTDTETVYAKFLDLDAEEKTVSAQMLQMAVSSQGGEIGSMLNIELGKMNYGSYKRLSENGDKIQIAMGIPESFLDKTMTYGVVCIRKDGTMEVCRDMDSKQSTVTFHVTGGAGAYALYRYASGE